MLSGESRAGSGAKLGAAVSGVVIVIAKRGGKGCCRLMSWRRMIMLTNDIFDDYD